MYPRARYLKLRAATRNIFIVAVERAFECRNQKTVASDSIIQFVLGGFNKADRNF